MSELEVIIKRYGQATCFFSRQRPHHEHLWEVKRQGGHMHVGKGHPITLHTLSLPFPLRESPLLTWTLLKSRALVCPQL